MAGFTLYETLRILLPGTMAIVITDIVLRIALRGDPIVGDGVNDTLRTLESAAVFIAFSVVVGLLLYLLDVPSRTRLSREGDPKNNKRLPSTVLDKYLETSDIRKHSFSLYFLLSDEYLPTESHRRVYLFGSLYRVYVDLRLLLALAITAGPLSGLIFVSRTQGFDASRGVSWDGAWTIAALLIASMAIGAVGIRTHALAIGRKPQRTFAADARDDLRKMIWVLLILASSDLIGGFAAATGRTPWQVLSVGLLAVGVLLWASVEMGPPSTSPRQTAWRSRIMKRLGATRAGPQFSSLQRFVSDLCLFVPWLLVALVVAVNQGKAPTFTAAWAIFVLPCIAIASLRKHEVRLLSTYEDQSVWLDLHSTQVDKIKRSKQAPDKWD